MRAQPDSVEGALSGAADEATLCSGHSALALTLLVFMSVFFWPRITAERGLWLGALCALSAALLACGWSARVRGASAVPWGLSWGPRREHVALLFAQTLIYAGWCAHWERAYTHLPLILAQVAFAYLIDMSSAWWRGPRYLLGLGPLTTVLSLNLFLFFKDEHFYWQWPLVVLAALSHRVTFGVQSGRKGPLFNPAALALGLAFITLILSDSMSYTWGEEIAQSHARGPWSFELIFGAGLLLIGFTGAGVTIISATLMTLALGAVYFEQTGSYLRVGAAIPAVAFLGINLLVADATYAPKSVAGRALLGALYSLGALVSYVYLRGLERPSIGDDAGLSLAFCDTLLVIPLLNLGAPLLERSTERWLRGGWLRRWWLANVHLPWGARAWAWLRTRAPLRLTLVALWSVTFIGLIRPQLKEHPSRSLAVWLQACDQTPAPYRARLACANRDLIYRRHCDRGDLKSCHNLALSWERGEGGRRELPVAISLYQKACAGGELLSCHHLGGLYVQEAEQRKERPLIERATPLLRRACEGEVWGACSRLAALMLSEWGAADQRREGWRLWELACEHKEPFACFELGQRALIPLAARLQRCQQGDAISCLSAERSSQGDQQAEPLSQARDELTVACQGEVWVACANLAWMLWRGDGGAQDAPRALSLMQKSCDAGLEDACKRARSMSLSAPPAH